MDSSCAIDHELLRRQVEHHLGGLPRDPALCALLREIEQTYLQYELKDPTYFSQFINNVPCAIFIKDTQLRYLYVNKFLQKMAGLEAEQWLGKKAAEVLPQPQAVLADNAAREVLLTGKSITTFETGGANWASHHWVVNRFPIFDRDGQVFMIGGCAMDVTEHHKARRERTRRRKVQIERDRLRKSISAMEQVMGVVSHELRTPLAGMRGVVEYLMAFGKKGTEEQTTFLSAMHTEILRMSDMVTNVLEAARINSGAMQWRWSDVCLSAAVTEALDTVRMLGVSDHICLESSVRPQDLVMRGDADAIRRIIVNLAANAQRHTSRGFIRVSVDAVQRGWIRIVCQDTGSGIDEKQLKMLGQPFAVGAGIVGSGHCGGTGLGLAICKGVAAAHGGYLEVQSRVGVGTTVTVQLRSDLPGPTGLHALSNQRLLENQRTQHVHDSGR